MRTQRTHDPDAIRAHAAAYAAAHPRMSGRAASADFGCSLGTYQRAIRGYVPVAEGKVMVTAPRVVRRRARNAVNDEVVLRVVAECRGNLAKAGRILRADHGITAGYLTIRRIVRGKQSADPNQRTEARFSLDPAVSKTARMPSADNAALTEQRTLYPRTVRDPGEHAVLKSGFHSAKIGRRVLKGRWTGFPIYTLTLEERATCPTSCRHWRSCFGNGMPWAHRHRHGPALEKRLLREVEALQLEHPGGFVVRLHVLGDFYSVRYVRLWKRMLDRFPALRVFGYTARIDGRGDPIAGELVRLVLARWDRFALRFSNAPVDECSTVSIEHPIQCPPDAVVCPQQTGRTESCSSCALCWESRKRVAFVQH